MFLHYFQKPDDENRTSVDSSESIIPGISRRSSAVEAEAEAAS